MSVHRMQFVLVNNMAPRNPSVCAACSRPLDRGYLHDLFTSRRYCGIECYRQSAVVNGFVGSIAPATALEFAAARPRLTVDVTSALFDSAWDATIAPDA
jgi:hypothetical protein